jgi:hypothetical protein
MKPGYSRAEARNLHAAIDRDEEVVADRLMRMLARVPDHTLHRDAGVALRGVSATADALHRIVERRTRQ